jgi:hypothetical protein
MKIQLPYDHDHHGPVSGITFIMHAQSLLKGKVNN